MSQEITESDVRHIATLSRLKLTDTEVHEFAAELGAILGYVRQLEEVDVEGIEPTAHAVELRDVLRDDEVRPSLPAEQATANAPQRDGTFFQVPKVLDQGAP